MQHVHTYTNQLHVEKLLRVALSLKVGRIRMSRINEKGILMSGGYMHKGTEATELGQAYENNSVSLLKGLEGH